MVGDLKVVSIFFHFNRVADRPITVSARLANESAVDRKLVGLTSVDDRLFVLLRPSQRQIQVYETKDFTSRKKAVRIESLRDHDGTGLTSCATNKCLYVSACRNNTVYKVELGRNNAVSCWSVADGPLGLSINAECNLLVACRTSGKIQEYNTTSKVMVREICLQGDELQPWHVIQLTGGRYVASCSNRDLSYIGVLEFNAKGEVLMCYGDQQLKSVSEQKGYGICHLAYDKSSKHVLLADRDNNRVAAINRPWNYCAKEMVVSVDGGLDRPLCLHFDESNRQLFIGEEGECRVTICRMETVRNLKLSRNLVTLKI
jgi:hypothetical protein